MVKIKDKSPVKIRKKKLSNGNYSLYLDIYNKGTRTYEYMKLYLIPERSSKAKEQNKKTLEVAEAIKTERLYNLQANKSTLLQQSSKELLLPFADYMEYEVERIKKLRTHNYSRKYKSGIEWVRRYDAKTPLKDITKEWIRGYIHFLQITPGKYNRLLNESTIHEYLLYVANILNIAVREGHISQSPMKYLSSSDRPKQYNSRREYLTMDELKKLINSPSPSKYNHIRLAFLFSCFTGLRYSDISQLKWSDIKKTDDSLSIVKKIQKTQDLLEIPLNKTAISFLPPKESSSIFNLPKSMASVELYIKVWSEFAEIDKHVTFHTARHTFAVNILNSGGDIYTLSKLLGHKRVTTTQIYADITEDKKLKTISLLDAFKK